MGWRTGCCSCSGACGTRLTRNGIEAVDPQGREVRPDGARGAFDAAGRGRRARHGRRGDAEGLPAWRSADPAGSCGGERVAAWLRISTRCWASPRGRPTRRSRRRTGSWRASTTLTATPTTRRRRRSSRRSRAPTTRSRIPRSARSTTPAGMFGGVRRRRAGARSGRAAAGRRVASHGDLGDIFSTIFSRGGGGGRAQPQQVRGRDLETEVSLSFDQAVNGAQVSVTVPKAERCPTCHGSGAKPGTSPVTCPRCEGRGIDAQSQGFFSISQPCPQCGGAGQIIEDPCPTCGGSGLTQQTKRYKVNIPAGVKDGARIRLAGKGEAGPARRAARRPLRRHPRRRLAGLQAARRRQPRGDGADHDRRGAARGDDRGADPGGHEEDQGRAGHQARLDPAPARRGRAEAEGPRQAATSATGSRSRCRRS